MDAATRQILAFHVGDRNGQSAHALWQKVPAVYQEHVVFYTDQYAVYTGSFLQLGTRRSPSWLARPITSEPPSISFVTTTSPSVQHYQNSTTRPHPLQR